MTRSARAWTGGVVTAVLLMVSAVAGITGAVESVDWDALPDGGPLGETALVEAEVLDVDEYGEWLGATWLDVGYTVDGEPEVAPVDWYQRPVPRVGDTITVAYEVDDPEWLWDPVEYALTDVPGDPAAGDPAAEDAAGGDRTALAAGIVAAATLVLAVLVGGLTVAWALSAPPRPAATAQPWAGHRPTYLQHPQDRPYPPNANYPYPPHPNYPNHSHHPQHPPGPPSPHSRGPAAPPGGERHPAGWPAPR